MEIVLAAKNLLAGVSWSTFAGVAILAGAIFVTLYLRTKAAA